MHVLGVIRGFWIESVGLLDVLSPEHIYIYIPNIPTQMINTNDDKNMYNIQMFFVY